jgi:hypothetical protein
MMLSWLLLFLQVRVATRNLGADNICAVVVVCLNVIRSILEETLKRLRAQGANGEGALDHLCSLVNDYDRLQVRQSASVQGAAKPASFSRSLILC